MNEHMTVSPLLPEQAAMQPINMTQHDATPLYYERRITFAPNTYFSGADYGAEAFAPVIGLGEAATKVVASVAPVEGSYHQATAADMSAAFEAYANGGVSPAVVAEVAAHEQQKLRDSMSVFSETDDEDETADSKSKTLLSV